MNCLGGKLMDVVVLMSDIRGFTAFTQAMTEQGKVKQLVDRLNTYFSEVVDAVHSEEGTVDKFIGDAVLAVFGAPLQKTRRTNVLAESKRRSHCRKDSLISIVPGLLKGNNPGIRWWSSATAGL